MYQEEEISLENTPNDKTDKDKQNIESNNQPPPRWVKVFGIVIIVIILLFVIMMLFGGGNHGPSRHFKFDDSSRPSTEQIEYKVQQL